jgi:ABC-type transporter Mla subunit MlaD
MHPATPQADRAIIKSVDDLNRLTSELKATRAGLAALRPPIAAASKCLDHVDDLLATVMHMLTDAYAEMDDDFERILKADSARFDFANDDDHAEDAA